MVERKKITVEVAYAIPELQRILSIQIEEGSTIQSAIERSGILQLFPDINLNKQPVGVFSSLRKLTDKVQHGDRVEIYRPLVIDPKEARKQRIKKR
ncbi:MAG: pasI [Gammaproteobacteria bacterium]|jgi:putative ubiquitin-RnfH superfamily antitoxin RatB of RatAB toxin-antitoxin module|nr:pasI [Gammaproteobacteria bacterium]